MDEDGCPAEDDVEKDGRCKRPARNEQFERLPTIMEEDPQKMRITVESKGF